MNFKRTFLLETISGKTPHWMGIEITEMDFASMNAVLSVGVVINLNQSEIKFR